MNFRAQPYVITNIEKRDGHRYTGTGPYATCLLKTAIEMKIENMPFIRLMNISMKKRIIYLGLFFCRSCISYFFFSEYILWRSNIFSLHSLIPIFLSHANVEYEQEEKIVKIQSNENLKWIFRVVRGRQNGTDTRRSKQNNKNKKGKTRRKNKKIG